MRIILTLFTIIMLGLSSFSTVQAATTVLINPTDRQVSVNGLNNQRVQNAINTTLRGVHVGTDAQLEIVSNNPSILSMKVPTEQGLRTFNFNLQTGYQLSFVNVVFEERFNRIMGYEAKTVEQFLVEADGFLVLKNGEFQKIPFSKIAYAIDFVNMQGYFNIFTVQEDANGKLWAAKSTDFLLVVLPADKMQGGAWRMKTVPGMVAPIVEINRSYVMKNTAQVAQGGYDVLLYSLQKNMNESLQLDYSVPGLPKENKSFTLQIVTNE